MHRVVFLKFKLTLVAIFLLLSTSIFFTNKSCAQLNLVVLPDTYTINITGAELNTISGLVINLTISNGSIEIKRGVTLKATGATLLLQEVKPLEGVISVAWTGSIVDGKALITGKLNPDTATGNPTISISKITASGGKDITNSVVSNVSLSSTQPTPTPTPTPSPTPTPKRVCNELEIPSSECACAQGAGLTRKGACACRANHIYLKDQGCTPYINPITPRDTSPFIKIFGSHILDVASLKNQKLNYIFTYEISGERFNRQPMRCLASTSNRSVLRVGPTKFAVVPSFDGTFKTKLKAKINSNYVQQLLNNETSGQKIQIIFSCNKGTFEQRKDLQIINSNTGVSP